MLYRLPRYNKPGMQGISPDPHVKEENVILRSHRITDALHMVSRLGADVAETVNVEPLNFDVPTNSLFVIERFEMVSAVFCAGRTEEMDVSHL